MSYCSTETYLASEEVIRRAMSYFGPEGLGLKDQDPLVQGRISGLLYPNARNEVQVGDRLGLVIGELRLEHLVVQ